jgi:hypothetical protein
MKKTILYPSLFLAGILLTGTTVNAQVVSTQTGGAGTTVTIPDTNGSGPGLTYNPSPGNLIAVSSAVNAYAITDMNSSAANGDRMEYGVWSGSTGYYQQTNPNSAAATPVLTDLTVDLSATTDLSTTPFTGGDWTAIGGGGS